MTMRSPEMTSPAFSPALLNVARTTLAALDAIEALHAEHGVWCECSACHDTRGVQWALQMLALALDSELTPEADYQELRLAHGDELAAVLLDHLRRRPPSP